MRQGWPRVVVITEFVAAAVVLLLLGHPVWAGFLVGFAVSYSL